MDPILCTVGYLISRYPAVSHTFILREILYLKKRGISVKTLSINPSDQLSSWTKETEEFQEKIQTRVLKELSCWTVLKHSLNIFFKYPWTSIKSLGYSLWLSGGSPRKSVWHLFYWLEALLTAFWKEEHNIEHLHVHFANPAALVALLATRIQGGSYSLTIHGPDELENSEAGLLQIKLKEAQKLFCVSYYAQSQTWRYLSPDEWQKTVVCPLGVDTTLYTPMKKERGAVTKILCVGRLSVIKGQRLLLEVCQQLCKEGYPLEVTLVGDGPEKKSLKQWISQKQATWVNLKGSLSQQETLAEYRQTDLFALPTFAEGLPVVLMEAMSMQLPCLTTTVNGIPELIQNGENGILVAPSDLQSLREGILVLINGNREMGIKARETVQKHFELDVNCERFCQELCKTLLLRSTSEKIMPK